MDPRLRTYVLYDVSVTLIYKGHLSCEKDICRQMNNESQIDPLVCEIDPGFTHQELWVDVVKVPCEAFALQLLPEGSTFADVAAVCSGHVLLKSKVVKNLNFFF